MEEFERVCMEWLMKEHQKGFSNIKTEKSRPWKTGKNLEL